MRISQCTIYTPRLHRDIVIEKGERIGQLLLVPYAQCDTFRVNELSSTIRGAGGFGSTGK